MYTCLERKQILILIPLQLVVPQYSVDMVGLVYSLTSVLSGYGRPCVFTDLSTQ